MTHRCLDKCCGGELLNVRIPARYPQMRGLCPDGEEGMVLLPKCPLQRLLPGGRGQVAQPVVLIRSIMGSLLSTSECAALLDSNQIKQKLLVLLGQFHNSNHMEAKTLLL